MPLQKIHILVDVFILDDRDKIEGCLAASLLFLLFEAALIQDKGLLDSDTVMIEKFLQTGVEGDILRTLRSHHIRVALGRLLPEGIGVDDQVGSPHQGLIYLEELIIGKFLGRSGDDQTAEGGRDLLFGKRDLLQGVIFLYHRRKAGKGLSVGPAAHGRRIRGCAEGAVIGKVSEIAIDADQGFHPFVDCLFDSVGVFQFVAGSEHRDL